MKKKEQIITQIDPQIEIDCKEILRLRRITIPSGSDMDSIYNLYKKYIDKNASAPIRTCNSCGQSIQNYYWKTIALPTEPIELEKLKK